MSISSLLPEASTTESTSENLPMVEPERRLQAISSLNTNPPKETSTDPANELTSQIEGFERDPYENFEARRHADGIIGMDIPINETDTLFLEANHFKGEKDANGTTTKDPYVLITARRSRKEQIIEDGMKLSQSQVIDGYTVAITKQGKVRTQLPPERSGEVIMAIDAMKSAVERIQLLNLYSATAEDTQDKVKIGKGLHAHDDFDAERDRRLDAKREYPLTDKEWAERENKLALISQYLQNRD